MLVTVPICIIHYYYYYVLLGFAVTIGVTVGLLPKFGVARKQVALQKCITILSAKGRSNGIKLV